MLKKLFKKAIAGWLAKRLAVRGGWKRKTWGRYGDVRDVHGRSARYGHSPDRPRMKDVVLGMILRRLER